MQRFDVQGFVRDALLCVLVFEYLVNEMPKFLQQFTTQILPPIWQLLTQTADIYVKVVVNQTEPNPFPDNDDGQS